MFKLMAKNKFCWEHLLVLLLLLCCGFSSLFFHMALGLRNDPWNFMGGTHSCHSLTCCCRGVFFVIAVVVVLFSTNFHKATLKLGKFNKHFRFLPKKNGKKISLIKLTQKSPRGWWTNNVLCMQSVDKLLNCFSIEIWSPVVRCSKWGKRGGGGGGIVQWTKVCVRVCVCGVKHVLDL